MNNKCKLPPPTSLSILKRKALLLLIFITLFGNLDNALHAFVGGEHWDAEAAAAGVDPSGTLPVIYINTENATPIDQKEEYINATAWVVGGEGNEKYDLGSEAEPLVLGIRGRGNASWLFVDKKPYKLKFDKKQNLIGLGKNKHYALLHQVGNYVAYFTSSLAFELGRNLINGWTPKVEPVEVVLNGQYIGIYFLTETIRIDSNRVDIAEQPVDNTDLATIDGGYLIELDNYKDVNQVVLTEKDANQTSIMLTAKTPEPMNEAHEKYITDQFNAFTDAIYSADKLSRDWEDIVDIESYAQHYVVEELVFNYDAYNGSCYLYKDFGTKWMFGPLWDAGDSMTEATEDFVINKSPFKQTWIREAVKYPRFIKKVQEIYAGFKSFPMEKWTDFIDKWCDRIFVAEMQNRKVWNYQRNADLREQSNSAKRIFKKHSEWLDTQWASGNLTCNVAAASSGKGVVCLGGHTYSDVDVFKGDALTVNVIPEEGALLASLIIDGQDRTTEVNNGEYKITSVDKDMEIVASFSAVSGIEDVTDGSCCVWHIDSDGNIISNIPVYVYTTSGSLVGSGTKCRIPSAGIYIIRAGVYSEKIVF